MKTNTYVKIDLDAIRDNLLAIGRQAGVPVMAVVKADAYGHGAVPVARQVEPLCAFFGVSSMEEALELRNAGIRLPILILGHTPASAFSQAIPLGIRPAIFSYADALALSQEAQRQNVTAPFHFALDTGMSRIGVQADREGLELCREIAGLPNLRAEGLFSHFATADCADLTFAREQGEKFAWFDGELRKMGIQVEIRHLDNSAGIVNSPCHYEMVRAGIVMYGMAPSGEVDCTGLGLRPALSWHSYVSHVKLLEPGRRIGYGGTFVTTRKTMVATVPAGYADGYRRSLSNGFYVLIRGKRAPILGKICMDQMMVDVTDIPGVRVDDPVVLVGRDGSEEITMEAIGERAGSFHYEFVCGISRRVPRIYFQKGRQQEQVHYLLVNG